MGRCGEGEDEVAGRRWVAGRGISSRLNVQGQESLGEGEMQQKKRVV